LVIPTCSMKLPYPTLSRFPAVRLVVGLALATLIAASIHAQPSGGPYGPIQQRYALPSAKHLFYVAPDGKADAPGATLEQPTTLESAIARVATGDAIILRGGTYRTGGLRLNQGITLQPYADERPVLKGTAVATAWTAQPNGLWRTPWTTLFPAAPADWWRRDRLEKVTPLHLFNNDMLFVDGELYAAVGRAEDVKGKTYFIDYENAQVYLADDPAHHLVEITAHDSALVRTYRDVHGKANDRQGPVIRGLTFTQYAYRALEVEGVEPGKYMDPSLFGKEVVGTTLENLTISYCSRVAGYFRGDRLVIRHCLVADCGTEGLYVINSGDVLLEGNIVTRTNSAEKLVGYYASAVKIFNQSYRTVCRDNLIIDNPNSSGVWYDVGNVDGVFVNNRVERTNDGFFFEISKGAICAGNVFVDCNRGVRILNSSKVEVWQNTFYNSMATFDRNERSAAGDHFGWHASSGPDVTERHDHVFANNLLVAADTFAGPLLETTQGKAVRDRLKEPHLKMLDGNVYVRRAGAKAWPLIAWGPVPTETNQQEIFSLADLRALQPQFETKARAFPDYWGPLFRGAEIGNFELLQAFPAATDVLPLPEKVRAALQWPAGAPSHPGAYAPLPSKFDQVR